MTNAQEKELFVEWALHDPHEQFEMIQEYLILTKEENCSRDQFLSFLKDKIEIESYQFQHVAYSLSLHFSDNTTIDNCTDTSGYLCSYRSLLHSIKFVLSP